MKHLWKAALGVVAVVLTALNETSLPESWHPYVLAATAVAAALGIYHVPYAPAPKNEDGQSTLLVLLVGALAVVVLLLVLGRIDTHN